MYNFRILSFNHSGYLGRKGDTFRCWNKVVSGLCVKEMFFSFFFLYK